MYVVGKKILYFKQQYNAGRIFPFHYTHTYCFVFIWWILFWCILWCCREQWILMMLKVVVWIRTMHFQYYVTLPKKIFLHRRLETHTFIPFMSYVNNNIVRRALSSTFKMEIWSVSFSIYAKNMVFYYLVEHWAVYLRSLIIDPIFCREHY